MSTRRHTCGIDGDPGAVAPLDGRCAACEAAGAGEPAETLCWRWNGTRIFDALAIHDGIEGVTRRLTPQDVLNLIRENDQMREALNQALAHSKPILRI